MGNRCELIEVCGFFKKYEQDWTVACKRLIKEYCTGPKMDECKRKEYRKQHGAPPPDGMMPTGHMFK